MVLFADEREMFGERLATGSSDDVGDGEDRRCSALGSCPCFRALAGMDEVDDDALLLANADQPLALAGIAQRVERQLDRLVAGPGLVVVGFFGLRDWSAARRRSASTNSDACSASSSGENVARSRVTWTNVTWTSRSQVTAKRSIGSPPSAWNDRTCSPTKSASARTAAVVEPPVDRVRERQRRVRRVRADAVQLREADQQRDNTVDRVGGLEGVARAVHGFSLSGSGVGGHSSPGDAPGTSGPVASPLNHSPRVPRKGEIFTVRPVSLA